MRVRSVIGRRAFAAGIGATIAAGQPSPPRRPALDLARRYRRPAVSARHDFAIEGGLMSFAAPTIFESVINLKVAAPLGLEISPTLARADAVIE